MHAEQLVDWNAVEADLRGLPRPDSVQELRLTWGEDATGDEAVWVWLRVPAGVTADPRALEAIEDFKNQVRSRLRELAPGIWPYIWLEN